MIDASPEFNPPTRKAVYDAIDTEREYQETIWPDHKHSTTEYLAYIQFYVTEGLAQAAKGDYVGELITMRKIAALAVAAQEQNGVMSRFIAKY